jgi:hypothetical protein
VAAAPHRGAADLIALHGYTHEDHPTASSSGGARSGPARRRRARVSGTRAAHADPLVRAAAQRVVETRFAAVSLAGMNVLGSFLSFRPTNRAWDRFTFSNGGGSSNFAAPRRGRGADRLVYPHPLRYERHAEFGCYG